ncbi:MAG: hypothetical protein GXZ04_06860 [Clostridiales bacterium]|nr:hypothetical protein [Clostridiales bacterium]
MSLPFETIYQSNQLTRWLAAMPRRFSCRQFKEPADVSQLAVLEYAAERICQKGIRIAIKSSGADDVVVSLPLFPRFKGHHQYAVILARKDLPNAQFLTGISGEAFALELAAQGLQGCWITGNYRRIVAAQAAKEHEQVMAVMPFGVPEDEDGARLTRRKILTAFSPDDPTLWPYWAYRAAESMRSAPSSLNRQPWRVSFSGSTLSFAGNKFNSVDSGIALMHIECSLAGEERVWRLAADNKTLLVSVEERDEPV